MAVAGGDWLAAWACSASVPYDYRAGQYLVVSLDLPVIGQALQSSADEPFAVFSMTVKTTAIAALQHERVILPPALPRRDVDDTGEEFLSIVDTAPAGLMPACPPAEIAFHRQVGRSLSL